MLIKKPDNNNNPVVFKKDRSLLMREKRGNRHIKEKNGFISIKEFKVKMAVDKNTRKMGRLFKEDIFLINLIKNHTGLYQTLRDAFFYITLFLKLYLRGNV